MTLADILLTFEAKFHFYSLVVGGRNALEEDLGLGRIDIVVNPVSPCCKPFVERL